MARKMNMDFSQFPLRNYTFQKETPFVHSQFLYTFPTSCFPPELAHVIPHLLFPHFFFPPNSVIFYIYIYTFLCKGFRNRKKEFVWVWGYRRLSGLENGGRAISSATTTTTTTNTSLVQNDLLAGRMKRELQSSEHVLIAWEKDLFSGPDGRVRRGGRAEGYSDEEIGWCVYWKSFNCPSWEE